MEVFYTVVLFVLGTIFGSFYNVVGFRLPENRSILKPSSRCPKCGHVLKWYELIPILSFFIQMGKCRSCKTKLSAFYPFTEALTGVLFAVSYMLFGFNYQFFISLFIISYLMIILVSDITFYIIPDEVTIFFSIAVFITKWIYLGFKEALIALGVALLLFTLMYLVMLLGNKLFKKESLGGGDIKLMFFVGLVLGPIEGIFSIFLSSALAFPFALITLLRKKSHIVPFGPFIVISLLIIYWLELDVLAILKSIALIGR